MRVVELLGHDPDTSKRISTDALRMALEHSGIEYLVTLPESPYEVLLRDLIRDSSIKIIQVCRESQGMAICSGLTYGNKVSALLCSYKGLYNSIDSLLGVALKTQSSFLFLVSDKEKAEDPTTSLEHGRHSASLLKTLGVPYYEIRSDDDMHIIAEAQAQTINNTLPIGIILRW